MNAKWTRTVQNSTVLTYGFKKKGVGVVTRMDGTKDISCVMSHEHRSELQFNQAACPGSYRQHVPGVTGRHTDWQRDRQADRHTN